MDTERWHVPVLLKEVIENIGVIPGRRFADLTFGEGGHSNALLERGAAEVIGVDRDVSAMQRYQEAGAFRADPRLRLIHGRNADVDSAVAGFANLDGILVDLGVSTRQLLQSERGFSIQNSGPLDMRMDPSSDGPRLLEFLAGQDEDSLAEILRQNAEVERARSVSRRILWALEQGKLATTADLAGLFPRAPFHKVHPATSIFLALRMELNDELGQVRRGMANWVDALRPGGKLCVITFHSVEDRQVKRLFKQLAGRCVCDERVCRCSLTAVVKILTPKPIGPSDKELAENPRSRSAKLRCVEKA